MKYIAKIWEAILITIVSGVILNSCAHGAGAIKRGIKSYERGDYGAAIAQFEAIEDRVPRWKPKAQALYFLYRGLSHLAIGEVEEAKQFILAAETLRQKDPRIIKGKHLIRLQQALGTLFGDEIQVYPQQEVQIVEIQ